MPKSDALEKSVIVIGGLLVDDIAISTEYLRARSSNPVQWQHRLGGVATNVALVVAQQISTLLIASVGDDNHGKLLANLTKEASIASSLVIRQQQNSDRYTAVLDHDGELYIGLSDARLAEQLNWEDIHSRLPDSRPDAIVLDANLSQSCIQNTVEAVHQHYQPAVPVIALSVSPIKSQRWLPVAKSVNTLLCNRREAAALTGLDEHADINTLADALTTKQFSRFAITDGSQPVLVQEHDSRHTIPVPPIAIEQSVNGAGDALAGAIIAQLVQGQSLVLAVEVSMPAAQSILSGDASPPTVQ